MKTLFALLVVFLATCAHASVAAATDTFRLASIWPPQFGAPSIFGYPVPGAFEGGHHSFSGHASPHPAVARIIVPEGAATSYGSGTLVDVREDYGLVVTNWHVIRDATGVIEVSFPDGFRSHARVLKVDEDWDLAALAIWRPQTAPVKISSTAPRPGDPLTICGYGAGNYRAVSGRCTQYYSPRLDLPQQMVELSVEARQGDSGGPIFNQHGELAGVLFGAGHGTTMGSYGGRVEEFLASLAPDIGHSTGENLVSCPQCVRDSTQASTVTPARSGEFQVVAHQSEGVDGEPVCEFDSQDAWCSSCVPPSGRRQLMETASLGKSEAGGLLRVPSEDSFEQPIFERPIESEGTDSENWESPCDLNAENFFDAVDGRIESVGHQGQDNWYEQAKNLLAAIGLVVISVRLLRMIC